LRGVDQGLLLQELDLLLNLLLGASPLHLALEVVEVAVHLIVVEGLQVVARPVEELFRKILERRSESKLAHVHSNFGWSVFLLLFQPDHLDLLLPLLQEQVFRHSLVGRRLAVVSGDEGVGEGLQRSHPCGRVPLQDVLYEVDELENRHLVLAAQVGQLHLFGSNILALPKQAGVDVLFEFAEEELPDELPHSFHLVDLPRRRVVGPLVEVALREKLFERLQFEVVLLLVEIVQSVSAARLVYHLRGNARGQVLVEDVRLLVVVLAGEERGLNEHFDSRAAQRPHVDAGVVAGDFFLVEAVVLHLHVTNEDFRRSIEARLDVSVGLVAVEDGAAEVDDLQRLNISRLVDHQVLRLQVAVDQPCLLERGQAFQNLACVLPHLVKIEAVLRLVDGVE